MLQLNIEQGIFLDAADDNEVIDNDVSGSSENGIMVMESDDNLIEENMVSDSFVAIVLEDAHGNDVLDNDLFSGIIKAGIDANWSTGNVIEGNEVSGSSWGILLRQDSNDNAQQLAAATGSGAFTGLQEQGETNPCRLRF